MNNLNPSRKLAARPRAGLFSVLILLAGWLAVVSPLRADNSPTYWFEIDPSAVPDGGFSPSAVALDRSNNIYVADSSNSRVETFTSRGSYLTQWGSYGTNNGQFENPQGIAVDSSNTVYVADTHNARVQKFDSNGNYLLQWGGYGANNGQFIDPGGIAIGSSDEVYVLDSGNNRVQKFTSNGSYLTQWGSSGSGNGQFSFVYGQEGGIAVDRSNNVYVVDQGNSRIEKFDGNGNYLTQWGYGLFSFGYGDEGIAVDPSTNIYVVDHSNDRIEKFDDNGNYLTQWGSLSDGNGIAVDSSGNFVYVAESFIYRIEVFVNNVNLAPPIITQQPGSQTVPAGVNVTIIVGNPAVSSYDYQWSSNNVPVPSATNASFTLTGVNLSASGNYFVLVTNSYGGLLSSNAVLTVLPSLVTTQPASGLSATGAMLNGSVSVGPDETVVWFDWGTDTNYGNIAGATIVPGNNGSNNVSTTISGLPGNFYHYRIDAANDFGIVYGEDQSFTVGFAPSATTLPPTNAANGATLVAVVNPEGWDTTVYFQWGTSNLANTTPGIDIGAGTTSLNVSSFVPGLSSSTPYKYQVVASNALGTAFGGIDYGDGGHAYLFSGSETNITLNPGTYIITAYGASGGYFQSRTTNFPGGLGAEMSGEFYFSTATNLTLLVGAGGDPYHSYYYYDYGGGGGGGGSFVVEGSIPLVIAGGGGGGGDFHGLWSNGTVGTNGVAGGGGVNGYSYTAAGGAGGTAGGGGGIGIGMGEVYGGYGVDYIYGGGGGGGFLGDGGFTYNGGGFSFEDGGHGGFGGGHYAGGGFGGGGAGGEGAPGGGGGYSGGGGGGYYGQYEPGYGGGGGSIIDSSAIAILAEVSGIASPDDPANGEIIITALPPPPLVIITTNAAFGFTNGVFGFNVSGPSGSNVVIQASADLQTWIPLQTNLLGSGPLYFSDPQSTTNVLRFYRAQLSP
jgi:sugar lactone lactonase YvrE